MANREQVKLLKQSVGSWNRWREENPDVEVDLIEANLRGTDLQGVNLRKADLSDANLNGANLNHAVLHGFSKVMKKGW